MQDLINKIILWGDAKGITGNLGKGTLIGQLDKTQEELNETRDAVVKHIALRGTSYRNEIKDGIGDCVVTLVLLADLMDMTLHDCVEHAYDQIKGRTGKMEGGVFVKDKP